MDGILILNKRKGLTSVDELNKLKDIIEEPSIGHTGTLDPIATGVLVVLLGKYTKLSDNLTSLSKEYIATVKLGIKTDTLDITGNVLEEKNTKIDKDKILNVINSYKKTYMQEVPLFSSVRIKGRHLYELARNGIADIELPKRKVTIEEIELLGINEDSFKFRCIVSKGTYIRSLIRDICNDAGILGTMSDLQRTKQGVFDIKDSYTIDDILKGNYKLINIEDIFDHEKRIINEENKLKIKNGNVIIKDTIKDYIYFYEHDKLVVIYKTHPTDINKMKPILWL